VDVEAPPLLQIADANTRGATLGTTVRGLRTVGIPPGVALPAHLVDAAPAFVVNVARREKLTGFPLGLALRKLRSSVENVVDSDVDSQHRGAFDGLTSGAREAKHAAGARVGKRFVVVQHMPGAAAALHRDPTIAIGSAVLGGANRDAMVDEGQP